MGLIIRQIRTVVDLKTEVAQPQLVIACGDGKREYGTICFPHPSVPPYGDSMGNFAEY